MAHPATASSSSNAAAAARRRGWPSSPRIRAGRNASQSRVAGWASGTRGFRSAGSGAVSKDRLAGSATDCSRPAAAILASFFSSVMCASEKAFGLSEKTSRMPMTPCAPRKGTAASERISISLHTSAFTRGSVSESLQRCERPLRRHSPEMPASTSSLAPSGGAVSPERARQITTPWLQRARAAPVASVK